jgi:single-stranded DNA-binding protein
MSSNFFFGTGLLVRYEERTVGEDSKRVSVFSVLLSEPFNQNNQSNQNKTNDKKKGTFIDVEAWNLPQSLSNLLNKNVKKVRVSVQGRFRQDRWQDKQTGANRAALKLVANSVAIDSFLQSSQNQGAPSQSQAPQPPQPTPSPAENVQVDSYGNPIPF